MHTASETCRHTGPECWTGMPGPAKGALSVQAHRTRPSPVASNHCGTEGRQTHTHTRARAGRKEKRREGLCNRAAEKEKGTWRGITQANHLDAFPEIQHKITCPPQPFFPSATRLPCTVLFYLAAPLPIAPLYHSICCMRSGYVVSPLTYVPRLR